MNSFAKLRNGESFLGVERGVFIESLLPKDFGVAFPTD